MWQSIYRNAEPKYNGDRKVSYFKKGKKSAIVHTMYLQFQCGKKLNRPNKSLHIKNHKKPIQIQSDEKLFNRQLKTEQTFILGFQQPNTPKELHETIPRFNLFASPHESTRVGAQNKN